MRSLIMLALIWAGPVAAQTILDSRFQPGTDCYRRSYDAAHLAAHPDQQVTEFAIGPWVNRFDGERLILLVEVHLRGTDGSFTGAGYCSIGKLLDCDVEGDGGRFTVEEAQDHAVILRLAGQGLWLEGPGDPVMLSASQGDDRVFRLDPVGPGLCPR